MDPKQQRRPKPPPLENRCGGLLVEPAPRGQGSSVAVDAAAIAVVAIARQPVGIVVDLNGRNGRNEGGRGHGDRGSLRLLHMMKSVVMLSRRVRRERRNSEARRKKDRREFHFVLHSEIRRHRRCLNSNLIEWGEETTTQASVL
jgi:hypothetical protein